MLFQQLSFLAAFSLLATAADLERATRLYEEEKFEEAADELRQVVGNRPDDATAQRLLGLSLIERDHLDEAERHISRAHELAPSGETRLALARLYVERKDFGRAEEYLNDASGPDLEFVRALLRFRRDQFEEAASAFEAALERNPQRAYAHYYAGMAYSKMGRKDRMFSHFDKFVKMRPDSPEARRVRAVLRTRG